MAFCQDVEPLSIIKPILCRAFVALKLLNNHVSLKYLIFIIEVVVT